VLDGDLCRSRSRRVGGSKERARECCETLDDGPLITRLVFVSCLHGSSRSMVVCEAPS